MWSAMVRTDGVVLSMALLSFALSGCGSGDAPTDPPTDPPTGAPTPAPTPVPISPEDAWERYKAAFKSNDVETLLASRSSRYGGIFQHEVVCFQNADGEEACGRGKTKMTKDSDVSISVFNRTTQPVIDSEVFDKHPTRPDYRIAALVWEAQWNGSTGKVSDSFGVDILVFLREIDPETSGEDWRVWFHVQVVDSKPAARDPKKSVFTCNEEAFMQRVCEKDPDGAVALFKENAVMRSYDKEGDETVNGLFTKDQLVTFFNATDLFTTDFPGSQINVIRGGRVNFDQEPAANYGNMMVLAGPVNNNYAQFPRRFVSLTFEDDSNTNPKIAYQYLARWDWAATAQVEHI